MRSFAQYLNDIKWEGDIYHLLKDPVLKEKIKNELRNNHQHHQWVRMGDSPQLEFFLRELLRLYPSVPIIARETKEKINLEGHHFLVGHSFLISLVDIGKNPFYYKDPLSFSPQRWDSQSEIFSEYSDKCFYPFGMGLRRCLGQWFAQFEFRTFINLFLQKDLPLELVNPQQDVKLKMHCTGLPSCPIIAQNKRPSVQNKISQEPIWSGEMNIESIQDLSNQTKKYDSISIIKFYHFIIFFYSPKITSIWNHKNITR